MAAVASARASKEASRHHFQLRLQAFLSNDEVKDQFDQSIQTRLLEILKGLEGPVAIFRCLADEPNLLPLLNSVPYREWAFPTLFGQSLGFRAYSRDSAWVRSTIGFWELSDHARPLELSQLVAVVVPGVAFDRKGGRLGRGKGYYDQTLEEFKGLKIGIGYSAQLSGEALPLEPHDVRMDRIVTERETLSVKG